MSEPSFSDRVLFRFVETVSSELGPDQFHAVLALSKLPDEWSDPAAFHKMNPNEAAKTYASLQSAMRTYFGRGARGALTRVGQRLWDHLLDDAALGGKAQAAVIKRLPPGMRRKAALELLAKFLAHESGDITVHTLDLDLLLADHRSPSAKGQTTSTPICYVTQGLISECLFWATGKTFNVEETSCLAKGEEACEFTITEN